MKVAFYKGTRPGMSGIVNRLIRWWTNSPYSHCELVVAPIDGADLCASSSFEDGGVRFIVTSLDAARWDVVEFVSDMATEKAAVEWFNNHLGEPYDLAAVFGFVWRRGHRIGHWDCSESIGAALGIPESWRFDPATLHAALSAHARDVPFETAMPAATAV
ncbi:hypothetical protein PQR71_13020 [Paraburkholderia fungorum]|uniref:hypothetical protein n=1 Tax=Paraburkholderia fungorum TaxID=134537 RepID=UPI0038BD7507